MQQIDVTFLRAAKVWWSYTWRALALWAVVFLALSIALGLSGVLSHLPGAHARPIKGALLAMVAAIQFIVGTCIGIFAMGWALKTRWSDFRVQAVAEDHSTPAT
jgi:hypothetical protein